MIKFLKKKILFFNIKNEKSEYEKIKLYIVLYNTFEKDIDKFYNDLSTLVCCKENCLDFNIFLINTLRFIKEKKSNKIIENFELNKEYFFYSFFTNNYVLLDRKEYIKNILINIGELNEEIENIKDEKNDFTSRSRHLLFTIRNQLCLFLESLILKNKYFN